MYSGDRLVLCVGEAYRNLENDPKLRHLSHQWNQVFEQVFRSGSKTVKLTDRHDVNVLSCVAGTILLLQSRAKLSSKERDYVEETIEIILAEFEELQVRIQFREDPDVTKKISDSLKLSVGLVLVITPVFQQLRRISRRSFVVSKRSSLRKLFATSIPNRL